MLLEGKNPEVECSLKYIPSLVEFFPEFMAKHGSLQSKSMQSFYEQRFKNIIRCPLLAEIPISEITRKLMSDYMYLRINTDKVSNATVNREATLIKTMLNKAVYWEFIEKNPLDRFKLLPEAPKRNVDLHMEDAVALLNELTQSFANVVEFAIYSGFRLEKILSMRIENLSFCNDVDTINVMQKDKGGQWKVFPVGPNGVEVLKRAIGNREKGYVFFNEQTGTRFFSVSKSFRRAVRKLDLRVGDSYLRFHDLRHVFATWLHEKGASLDELRILLGHSKRSTTDRYTTAFTSGAANVLKLMPQIRKSSSIKSKNFDTNLTQSIR
jgi:integrase